MSLPVIACHRVVLRGIVLNDFAMYCMVLHQLCCMPPITKNYQILGQKCISFAWHCLVLQGIAMSSKLLGLAEILTKSVDPRDTWVTGSDKKAAEENR